MEQKGAINELIEALKRLPGIGPKAAQRIAYQLLTTDKDDAIRLGNAIDAAVKTVKRCPMCNNLTDSDICRICSSAHRDRSQLCVVESVADLVTIEQSLSFNGMYFILMGRLSPLNGVGPREISLDKLLERCAAPELAEVVLATSFTAEGSDGTCSDRAA